MKDFFKNSAAKVCGGCSFLKSKALLFAAGAASMLMGASVHAVGTDLSVTDFVTTTEAGAVSVDPNALVVPVRALVVASITAAISIFLIFLGMKVVLWLVKRFSTGR